MKLFTASALTLLAAGAAYGQGIFNIVPHDDSTESLPLQYRLTAAIGYDDNVSPLTEELPDPDSLTDELGEQDALYSRVELGASFVSISPQTNFNLDANVNYTYYFDNIEGGDDGYVGTRVALNVAHSVSERLRLVSRNFVNYGLEPDYQYGSAQDRRNDEYLYLSTENAIGYKWTDRFATYSGVRYDTLDYDESNADRNNFTVFNQFRYIGSPQTVYTLDYRYRWADNKGARDSDNQYILLGVEHRLSANSVVIARAGAQLRDVDGGDDDTSPFFELGYRSRINEQFDIRAWAKYGIEDYDTSVDGIQYDNSQTLRISLAANYMLSREVTFTGGINYINTSYEDGFSSFPLADTSDVDVDLINLYLGATYQFSECCSANITYNFTTSDSDSDSRDYDRNRIQVGLTYVF
ncbi:hypothetical protein Rhal01_03355 [Rubritalea halochordaticola]|uniref:Outer membrane protein beta-barrel domain-containing protein n=1 Tax=Rubritalea halochordaticola TaxID=714537 RepID=A0ABP9V5A9_9BACT